MTPLCVLIAGGSTRECERYSSLVLIHLSIHYLAIYIYPIYRHAAADDKSDIATRDNFGALLPEKSNHIAWRKKEREKRQVNLYSRVIHRWSGKTVQPPAGTYLLGGGGEKRKKKRKKKPRHSVLSSQPVHLESCRRPAAAGDT
ncbi:hypothetical protein ALC56_11407 [Trachymyrmex septentrionalis]|uniref:Uncharacterized protein n=1 Tax=Trachymyrmex septentrionalis TaxID=34720 RepID=A0A195F155_9HYME|nr:hypothetical protein ALC56_11407 [Trachymyrmex septentrionalis]